MTAPLTDQPAENVPRRRASLPQKFEKIPVEDPAEALEFCRRLAVFLSGSGTESVADERVQPGILERAAGSTTGGPEITVILPVFNEQENIPVLYERLTVVLGSSAVSYEIIFVDDGSRDQSLRLLNQLADQDHRVVVLELARNFGHQVAISAGMDFACGQAVIIMDADLQDPPEVLPQFIAKWREGHDVVYAIRARRKEAWLKRFAYSVFYRLLQKVANIDIPLDAGDFCIMDRRVVDLLVDMPERNRFVRGIRSWVGLDQVGLAYERQARSAGKPKYTFTRLVYLALDGLVSFSYLPLRLISLLGGIVSLVSFFLAIVYIIQKLTIGLNPPGFATLIVSVFFLAGIQLLTIGVIGEYIGRIFEEVKQRPLYVVRKVTRGRS